MKAPEEGFSLRHCVRMSNDTRLLRYARRINRQFLEEKKTDLESLDSEYEAVYLEDDEGNYASIVVFARIETHRQKDTYYWIPVVFTEPGYRGLGLYGVLIKWLKEHARKHGASSLSTEVKAHNGKMNTIQDKHWQRDYIRYKLPIKRKA